MTESRLPNACSAGWNFHLAVQHSLSRSWIGSLRCMDHKSTRIQATSGVFMFLARFAALTFMVIVLLATAYPCRAAENVWSVEYFNSRKSEWDQFTGATIRIEGRVSLSGGGQMRLSKCEVPIRGADSLIRSVQGKKSVEITGRLKKEAGKYVLEAEQIQQVPTDLEQYESRTAKLRNPKAPDWYVIGDWAAERSRFYDDTELEKKALSAYEHAISAERRALESDDANGRFELAKKVFQYKLPDRLRMELIHEGDRLLWNAQAKAKPADKDALNQLCKKIADDLPGSSQPLTAFPEQLTGRYEREPLAIYHDSSDDVRRQLHRLFYAAVQLKIILDDAISDGRNGDIIAMRLSESVPEATQLAEQYRTLKLKWRLEKAVTATRPEIEQLAADFRERQQPDQAKLAITRWLQARESRLREDGPLGMMQLADEHLALLQDEQKAAAILVEANKIDPAFADVKEKLKSMGYENLGGTWVKSRPQTTPAPIAEVPTISSGVAIGMTATAARNAMGIRPGAITRVLTKSGAAEIWSFGTRGTSRVIIRLEGTNLSPEPTVVEIRNEK